MQLFAHLLVIFLFSCCIQGGVHLSSCEEAWARCCWRQVISTNVKPVSAILNRLVRQLMKYLASTDILPTLQSESRPGHLTETAVLCMLADILRAIDRDVAALVLLDVGLSVAFDMVDHVILLQQLKIGFGTDDAVHRWFQLYHLGRSQSRRHGTLTSYLRVWRLVSHRAQCWVQCCLFNTPLTWLH